MQPTGHLECLQQAAALRCLKEQDLARLLEACEVREFLPGEVLVEEGAPAGELYVLVDGIVAITKRTAEREEHRIASRSKGEWVGEAAVFAGSPRSATVVAESAVAAIAVPRERFLEVVGGSVEALLDLLQTVMQRLHESDAQLIDGLRQRVWTLSSANDRLSRQNSRLRAALDAQHDFEGFVGASGAARAVRAAARQAAQSDIPILLLGETGTGKEILARAIHAASDRSSARFVALNCGFLRESLLESELFGHARGAFTGAHRAKRGLVEAAAGGTLLLDEVGDMPGAVQSAFLRFIELGEFRRLGETEVRHADVRVIAATHRSLDDAVRQGRFRRDLLYRLDVIRISIPPLREHTEDLPLLVSHCLEGTARRLDVEPFVMSPAALRALASYDFPGNVRELENEIERLYAFLEPGSVIGEKDLAPRFLGGTAGPDGTYAEVLRDFKSRVIERALRDSGGNRAHAAARLGLHRSNLVRMMRELGVRSLD